METDPIVRVAASDSGLVRWLQGLEDTRLFYLIVRSIPTLLSLKALPTAKKPYC